MISAATVLLLHSAVERLPLVRPIDVGHVVDFVGHQLLTPVVPPGGTVELLTFWRVPGTSPEVAEQDLVVEIPKYTINMVSENH